MSKDFKWSDVPDKQRWVVAWGVIWRWFVIYLGILAGLLILVYGLGA